MSFIAWWLLAAAGTFLILSVLGLVPQEVKELNATVLSFFGGPGPAVATSSQNSINTGIPLSSEAENPNVEGKVLPARIVIKKIGVNASVSNPESRDLDVLNDALLSGAVRYPGSGTLEETANMLIFGHSSRLPVVNNLAFKSFNRLQELQLGDEIEVYSTGKIYRYKVTSVAMAAADQVLVKFKGEGRKLTLATCDNFSSKADRFVVEATFIETTSLSNTL